MQSAERNRLGIHDAITVLEGKMVSTHLKKCTRMTGNGLRSGG